MNVPDKMNAIEISEPGDSCVLRIVERPVPTLDTDEVLIRVAAAGLNRPDIMQRKGLYPAPPSASDIPGLEISGTIVNPGTNTTGLKTGDLVCALVTGGGYAEYCKASAQLCLVVPAGFSVIQAAAIPETFFTAWSNLFDRGRLSSGESLLIHGGSSGIGTTAIQLAKALGTTVIVTAGTEEKCDYCINLGADAAINYRKSDFVEEIKQATNSKGVDVILDMIGGDYFPRNLQCLAYDGRLVQIAVQNGYQSKINLLSVMLKRLTITGSTLRARSTDFKAGIASNLLKNVWPLFLNGSVKPVIDRTFPLADASSAHDFMESNQHIGKIILTVRDPDF